MMNSEGIDVVLLYQNIVTIAPAPPVHQFLRSNSVLAGDSSSGFDRGITHFFMATRNTTEGVGEKEQRTNE